ncbi:16S rRNA (cytidine(1402)-2'-O)-methyltransferase [Paenarthrobacter sp. Z7-10]|uniref:16S rRNA (cytidine(1402)-2'-O)-methyltransferase n=1 Tax=Paenarthrobacter sp. Z7-10 TaxID=2787635 RepID=UPI0022A94A6B|nr:16S rRNA (cytidine(1402)-2'-O)-methyltransferase [Paenarthrobacter sp. Z7-10]MCZ2403260.1 16S rRNA (cytidine(1402)-2'-O)-methyltransferase [Paenarthrobacter sp. Z7-10]
MDEQQFGSIGPDGGGPAGAGGSVQPGEEAGPPLEQPGRAGVGYIILAATPIGNMGDASARLIEWLAAADLIAAEDTRRLHRLVQALGVSITGRVISYHEHNEASRTQDLLEQVGAGKTLLMVTDAGMPAVSDPGFRLVEAAAAAGIRITAVPGPSAVLTALALSGLPTDRFCFEGFLPRKTGERAGRLAELASERRTMVFFEAPHRLEPMLRALDEAFGPQRRAAIARELTKTYEQVLRGSLREMLEWAEAADVRGEIAVVVAGASESSASRPEDSVEAVNQLMATGIRLKDAVAAVAEDARISKRELYSAVLAAR